MSLKAGAKRSAARPPFFCFDIYPRAGGKVGILLLDFHFSIRPRRRGGGNVEIALLAISKGSWVRRETCLWFSSASTARHFHRPFPHAVRFLRKLSKSFCLAFCIASAAAVSVCRRALCSSCGTVTPCLRCLARSGSWRRISHGVAYQRYTRFSLPFALTFRSGTPHGR